MTTGADLTVEYGIREAGGRVEPTTSRAYAERLVRNDPRREIVTRSITPWTIEGANE